jgi:hypothetical protein
MCAGCRPCPFSLLSRSRHVFFPLLALANHCAALRPPLPCCCLQDVLPECLPPALALISPDAPAASVLTAWCGPKNMCLSAGLIPWTVTLKVRDHMSFDHLLSDVKSLSVPGFRFTMGKV